MGGQEYCPEKATLTILRWLSLPQSLEIYLLTTVLIRDGGDNWEVVRLQTARQLIICRNFFYYCLEALCWHHCVFKHSIARTRIMKVKNTAKPQPNVN